MSLRRQPTQSNAQPVVVVGAGIGGLASALQLAAQGVDTVLIERAAVPGGKLRQVPVGGTPIDSGPTVFTMRWVFDELFDLAGADLSRSLALTPLDVLARHAWSGDERLDLHADRKQSADAIGAFSGAAAARGYLDFCDRAERIYRSLEGPFLRSTRPNPLSLAVRAGLRGLPALLQISPFTTLWHELGKHFADPRLRQLFGRYATYCGSSPFSAPATLMLVAHVEQSGVWTIAGGMQRLAQAMTALAVARGVRIRCSESVDEILVRDGRAAGVRLASGEEILARAVVFNGDVAALGAGLLGSPAGSAAGIDTGMGARIRAHLRTRGNAPVEGVAQRSLSAVTWSLLARTEGFPLARHTIFFSDDSKREFDDIFVRARLPDRPTVYVCAQDREEPIGEPDQAADAGRGNPAAAGTERMFCIVNAPARGDALLPFKLEDLDRCEARTFQRMSDCGLQVRWNPQASVRTTPADFERLFPATGGALYGRASHGWTASFVRPGSRSRLPGLYLAGGSTHPGPGVPMAALSGRLAATSVMADLTASRGRSRPSMRPSFPAATPGGTSTR